MKLIEILKRSKDIVINLSKNMYMKGSTFVESKLGSHLIVGSITAIVTAKATQLFSKSETVRELEKMKSDYDALRDSHDKSEVSHHDAYSLNQKFIEKNNNLRDEIRHENKKVEHLKFQLILLEQAHNNSWCFWKQKPTQYHSAFLEEQLLLAQESKIINERRP